MIYRNGAWALRPVQSSIEDLTDEQYWRAVRANMDGVVYGVRELAARLMPKGGSIVATASLAGLTR